MKIVILDGYTVNPGDLSWEPLEALGGLEVFERTPPEKTLERCRGAWVIITSKVVIDREIISKLKDLKYIGVIATGYNVIDLEAAKERNIVVTNIPNYCTSSVAQLVFAHMLELARRVGHHDKTVKEGKWEKALDFCYWDYPQMELTGKTLGLFGCGNIGRAVSEIAFKFGMKVIAYDKYPQPEKSPQIEFVDEDTVFSRSDVLSLHCPLMPETKGIINSSNLSKMKKTAFLINTGRGPLVNEKDLADALESGVIAGAGIDVLNTEPPVEGSPLFRAPNCHITPHIAWSSIESRKRLIELTANNIKAFLNNDPQNVVN